MTDGMIRKVNELREKGIIISEQESHMVMELCKRKLQIIKYPYVDKEYLEILFSNEVENYLKRRVTNTKTLLFMAENGLREHKKIPV